MTLKSIDPSTGETVATFEETSPDEVAARAEAAHGAHLAWRRVDIAERARLVLDLAGVLEARRDDAARLMAREMGKPLAQGRAEIDKCAWLCRHAAEHGPAALADEPVATEAARSYVSYRPLGVVAAIMPWNFPYWQVLRFAVPSLLAGNTALLKHASNVCGCALDIEACFAEAGFPADAFRTLLVPASRVDSILEHPRVRAASLTGSTPAGRAVASAAGRLLKKTVLELGGSDPYVVLPDADIEHAARTCVASRLINGGQSCIAAKRFIVPREIAGPFTEAVVGEMSARPMGHPIEEEVDLGPQARVDLRDALHEQVEACVDAGARLLVGGTVPDGPGAFYPPTVLADVGPGMPAWDEELFGPVAAIVPVDGEREAIEVANATSFGLGAAVFTRDVARGEALARDELAAGSVFVNGFVKSDPRLPFGGIGDSGYGRELGTIGMREFVNVKTVWVESG